MEKVNKLIKSFLNRKTLKLNSILNKVFKAIILIIIKDLAEIASCYFASEIILKHFKKSIIIVLRKEGGKYSLLSSYKLIALKNILIKVLKKHVVNIMSKTAKEHRLFL